MAAKAASKPSPARGGSDDESVDVPSSHDPKGIVTAMSSESLIKDACRRGLTTDRGNIWMKLAGAVDSEERYLAALEKVFGASFEKPSKIYRVRACVGCPSFSTVTLPTLAASVHLLHLTFTLNICV
jgi:hypothetical protein